MPSLLVDRSVRTWRRLRHGRPVVIVSGLPRSGTSVVMQMLQAGGLPVFTDSVRAADADNPRGYLEYEPVKMLVDQPDTRWVRGARGRALKVISYLLPHLPRDNNYDILFVERDLAEVVASQNRMLARRGVSTPEDQADTVRTLESHLAIVKRRLASWRIARTLMVSYRHLIEAPVAEAERIQQFLGMPLDIAAMAGVVDPRLYRNRSAHE